MRLFLSVFCFGVGLVGTVSQAGKVCLINKTSAQVSYKLGSSQNYDLLSAGYAILEHTPFSNDSIRFDRDTRVGKVDSVSYRIESKDSNIKSSGECFNGPDVPVYKFKYTGKPNQIDLYR